MTPGKRISLKGWKLIYSEFWDYSEVLPNGNINIRKEKNPAKDHKKRERMVVRVHQKNFGKEIMTVRSIYFFNRIHPSIQLWHSADNPDFQNNSQPDFLEMQERWWQSEFYKVIKMRDEWYQLENNEYIDFGTFKRKRGKVIGIFVKVIKQDSPDSDKTEVDKFIIE